MQKGNVDMKETADSFTQRFVTNSEPSDWKYTMKKDVAKKSVPISTPMRAETHSKPKRVQDLSADSTTWKEPSTTQNNQVKNKPMKPKTDLKYLYN